MRLILVYLSINPSSSQIFGESLNPIHNIIGEFKCTVFPIQMYKKV